MVINNAELEEKFNLLTKFHSEMSQYRSLSKKQEDQPYTAPTEIPFKIRKLIDWSQKAVNQLHPVQYAADLH